MAFSEEVQVQSYAAVHGVFTFCVLYNVGRLGVVACLACVAAAAVDRQAPLVCLV